MLMHADLALRKAEVPRSLSALCPGFSEQWDVRKSVSCHECELLRGQIAAFKGKISDITPRTARGVQFSEKALQKKTNATHLQYAAFTGSEPKGSGWILCSYTVGKNSFWKSCSQACTHFNPSFMGIRPFIMQCIAESGDAIAM